MTSKAHIIHVIADAGPGGAPSHVIGLLRGLKQQAPEFERSLISPTGWITTAAKDLAQVIPADITSALGRDSHQQFRSALIKALKSHPELDAILHFHGVRAGTLGSLNLRYRRPKQKLNMVYTEHLWTRDYHLPNKFRELLQLRLLGGVGRRADRVIAVSNAVATFLLERKLALPEHVVMIPNGVDLPDALHGQAKRPDQTYHLGSIGSLVPLKGYADLITALPLIRQNHPQAHLTIIGDGPEKKSLQRLAKRLGVDRATHFLGSVPDTTTQLMNWDLFISTSHSESFGLGIAEAMAAGLPVIATHVGGVPELVTKETGHLVPPRDPHMLAKVVIDLLNKPAERARLGSAGRQRIAKHFNRTQMVSQTQAVYQDVLKSD